MSEPFEFLVPASTANVGPGFGVLGLALDLHFEIRVEERGLDDHVVERPDAPDDKTLDLRHDAILRGLKAAAVHWKIELPPGLALTTRGEVPRGTGLGTNSADFASGLLAAVHYAKEAPPLDDQLALLVDLGADPAHAAATLFGGLVVAVPVHRASETRRFVGLRHRLAPDWRFVIAAPRVQIGTADVHRVVPAQLPNAVVQRTAGRLVGLLAALANGDERLLAPCLVDEVHVPFRIDLAPGMRAAMDAARDAGAAGATISGHGPAILAMTTHEERGEDIAQAMSDAFVAHSVPARSIVTRAWLPELAGVPATSAGDPSEPSRGAEPS